MIDSAPQDKNPGTDQEMLRVQFAALREIYAAELPVKLERMRELRRTFGAGPGTDDGSEAAVNQPLRDLQSLAHNLAGSGATYGYPQLSEAARALEKELTSVIAGGALDAKCLAQIDAALERVATAIQKDSKNTNDAPHHLVTTASVPFQSLWTGSTRRLVYLRTCDVETRDLAAQIEHFGYSMRCFDSIEGLRGGLAREVPAAIIADAPSADDLEALHEVLALHDAAHPQEARPQIVMVSERGDMESRLQAVRAGGSAYFTKPLDVSELIDKLDSLTAQEPVSPYRILIVDDEEKLATFYALTLRGAGMETGVVTDAFQVMQRLSDLRPDLILMDVYMPQCSGLELATAIRQQEDYVSIPIVFLSAETDLQKQLAAMNSGGDDFLVKPIEPEHLMAAVATRAGRSRTLRSFMIRDSLTGLLNHTTTKEQLDIEVMRARRATGALSFAMIDIDRFKSINDSYGHLIGDRVIKSLARILSQRLRKTDIIGRYGGEEFAAILPGTDGATAVRVLDEIREGFSKLQYHSEKGDFSVTFSCGIAEFPPCSDAPRLNDSADKALYQAKRSGRNRVVLAP